MLLGNAALRDFSKALNISVLKHRGQTVTSVTSLSAVGSCSRSSPPADTDPREQTDRCRVTSHRLTRDPVTPPHTAFSHVCLMYYNTMTFIILQKQLYDE